MANETSGPNRHPFFSTARRALPDGEPQNGMPREIDGMPVYPVGLLCQLIKTTLEADFGQVLVSGEVSNLREYDSGHVYFTIKEPKASLSAVLFAGVRRGLPAGLKLKDGMKAVFAGRVSLYADRGQCQLVVTNVIVQTGEGELFRKFEELKTKLSAEGLFAEARKKTLPWYPRRVAVVTSTGGSVLHDIIETSAGRAPGIDIVVYPSAVQGDAAAAELCAAIRQADRDALSDVIIVARGGGSLEDLWPFNDETLARTIAACRTPVVSGVGHEPDFTICDFVADLRAPTPSTAALRVFPEREALADSVTSYGRRIADCSRRALRRAAERLAARSPEALRRRVRSRIESLMQTTDTLTGTIRGRSRLALAEARGRLAAAAARLEKHDPRLPFRKGFAIVRRKGQTAALADASVLRPDDAVEIVFARGQAGARITDVDLSKESSK